MLKPAQFTTQLFQQQSQLCEMTFFFCRQFCHSETPKTLDSWSSGDHQKFVSGGSKTGTGSRTILKELKKNGGEGCLSRFCDSPLFYSLTRHFRVRR
jgi:hypothetical protein